MQTTQSCSARDYLQSRGLQSAYISLTYLSFDTCSLPRECGPDGWRKHVTGRGTSRNLYQLGPSRAAAGNLLSAELSPGRAYAGMVLNKFCGVVMRACFTCCWYNVQVEVYVNRHQKALKLPGLHEKYYYNYWFDWFWFDCRRIHIFPDLGTKHYITVYDSKQS